jgi:tRNA (guanine26-N2/guanine27-N2)-dimethyltransferase
MIEERGIKLDIKQGKIRKSDEIFYNPEMIINRDISVGALAAFSQNFERLEICEPLSASGIRGLRYFREVKGIEKVVLNDLNPTCFKSIKTNIKINGFDPEKFEVFNEDASHLLLKNRKRFHYVDIDPFGSPMPYIFASAQALKNGALFGVTATDLAPLCGVYKETCLRRYASIASRTSFLHELGLRLLIKALVAEFAKYDLKFSPLLGFYQKHYYRIFGRVFESAKGANRQIKRLKYLEWCRKCDFRDYFNLDELERKCPFCSTKTEVLGPVWAEKLGEERFCENVGEILKKNKYEKAMKIVEMVKGELLLTIPYYDSHYLSHIKRRGGLKLEEILEGLKNSGFRAVRTHFSPTGFKTNAPINIIEKIFKN